jgi:transglutaminase-like putative cysteine protease
MRKRRLAKLAPAGLPSGAWLRGGVFAVAAGVFWWPLTPEAGIAAGVAGAALASLLADARSLAPGSGRRLRAGARIALVITAGLLGAGFARLVTETSFVASVVGASAALQASEALLTFSLTAAPVFLLRAAAARRPVLAMAEIAVVASALIASLAAHREGMVHRPRALGDFAWTQGFDPTLVFVALGGGSILLLAALLVSEQGRMRLLRHFGALAIVALLLVGLIRLNGLPQPRPPGELGLTGEGAAGESQGAGDSSQLQELLFKDEYSADGGRAPVAVVLLHDDYSPSSGVYYFRQTVFSSYNGRRLVRATRDDVDRDVVDGFPVEVITVPAGPPDSDERAPLETTTGLLLEHVQPFALDAPVRFQPAENAAGLRFVRSYETLSRVATHSYDALLGQRPGNPEWSDSQWEHYTEVPGDPRYASTAQKLIQTLQEKFRDDPFARALAVKLYLDEEGIYSLKSRHADAEDPAASFLFGDLTGYCVHFAHAAVYLFRSLGIPARVAAGYAVSEGDRQGGSAIMIRGLNAHAWPEIYLAESGWIGIDPTPKRTLDEAAPPADADLQRMLGEMLRSQRQADRPPPEPPSRLDFADVLRRFGQLLLLAVGIAFGVKLYRALAPRFASPRRLDRIAYRAALDRLADVGLLRRFGETRERFAARAIPVAPSFGSLTSVHLGRALGSRRTGDAGTLRELEATARREIRQRVPRWRRWLGTGNPFSWLFVH